MLLGITIVLLSIGGIIYGIREKKKSAAIVSAIVLILTIAVWTYFYFNLY